MDKRLFFTVWDLPELRALIKSFMYPGKKTSNYYDYKDASAALNGYLRFLIERDDKLVFYNCAMDFAADHGYLEVIKWLHYNRTEGCTTYAIDWAARSGHLDVIIWLYEHRTEGCTTDAMDSAAEYGNLDVIKWLHHNRMEGCTGDAMYWAARNGHLDVVKWLYKYGVGRYTTDAMDGSITGDI